MTDDPLIVSTSKALLNVMEALAHFAMEVGVGVGDVQALTERAFVSAAQSTLRESGDSDPKSDTARIAVRTGLYRATVNQLLTMRDPHSVRIKPFQNFSVRVMRSWQTSPGYSESSGVPRVLPLLGSPPSFQALIEASVGADLSRTILKDLQRVGAVKRVGKGHVQLVRFSYSSNAWDEAQIAQVGDELRDHIRALTDLLRRREPAPLHRYVASDALSTEGAAILARDFSSSLNSLFNGFSKAIEHEAGESRPSKGPKSRLTAHVIIQREPIMVRKNAKGASHRSRFASGGPKKPGRTRKNSR